MTHLTPCWLRSTLLAAAGAALAGLALFACLPGVEGGPRLGPARPDGGSAPAGPVAADLSAADRDAAAADLGCWGAPIGAQFVHRVDDRCDFRIRSAEAGEQPGGRLHTQCDVTTTVLDRKDGEVLVQLQIDALRFVGADGAAITGDPVQESLAAAAATPVLVRLGARGDVRGYGFAAGLNGDQRNFLRGTLGLFAFEAPPAHGRAWDAAAADTTGAFAAHYEVLPQRRAGEIAVRRTRVRYTAIAGQDPVPEHRLSGDATAHFATGLGWLESAALHEGMTLALSLLDLWADSERTATIALLDARTVVSDVDLAAAWAHATAPASGAGEAVGAYAAGSERRRWQEQLRGVTLDELLAELSRALGAQPADAEAVDRVFQRLQWFLQLDDRAAAQLGEQLATRQLGLEAAQVALGALGAAGTEAAQRVLVDVRADASLGADVRQAATIACLQLEKPNEALLAGMVADAGGDSDLRGPSMLVLGAVAPRAGAPLADGRSPVAALLAMERGAAARGELSTWLLAVANCNPPEALPIAQRLLDDADASVRGAACVALRGQPATAALGALVDRGLADSEPGVRLEALLALGRRSEPAARAAIERVAAQDPDEAVRARARRLLGQGS